MAVLSQRLAIARYLADKFGLAGKNEIDRALSDMYVHQVADIQDEYVRAVVFERDEDRKAMLKKRFIEESLPNTLKRLEAHLARVGTGFLVGNELTWADLYLNQVVDDLHHGTFSNTFSLVQFPLVKANVEKVSSIPRIAEWKRKIRGY